MECSKGYYCEEATPEEVACPTGTYNPDTTKGNITDCKPCDAGLVCTEYTFRKPVDLLMYIRNVGLNLKKGISFHVHYLDTSA